MEEIFNIGKRELNQAIKSRHYLEALAFCLLVKDTHPSSTIHNATIKNLKTEFHIGYTRMKSILHYGIQFGWIYIDKKNNLHVNRLYHSTKRSCLKIRVERNKINGLTKTTDELRKCSMLFAVESKDELKSCLKMIDNPTSERGYKKARRIKEDMRFANILPTTTTYNFMRASHSCRTKTIRLRKELERDGLLTSEGFGFEVKIKPNELTESIREMYQEMEFGYLVRQGGKVFHYLGNVYKVAGNVFSRKVFC